MRLLVIAICLLAVAGCKSNCRQIAERLCECSINSVEKDSCLRTASAAEGSNPPSKEDEATCSRLLKPEDGGIGCDCRLIDTASGKIRCGLARPGGAVTTPSGDGGS